MFHVVVAARYCSLDCVEAHNIIAMDQDIIWHAFKQSCTVKMIQRTALASPHSGTNERGQSLVKYHKFVKQARFSFVFMCVCWGRGCCSVHAPFCCKKNYLLLDFDFCSCLCCRSGFCYIPEKGSSRDGSCKIR